MPFDSVDLFVKWIISVTVVFFSIDLGDKNEFYVSRIM